MAGTSTIAASARQEEQEVATSTTSEAERRKAAGASLGQKNSRWSRVNKLKGAAARSGKVKYREEVHEHVDVKAAAPPAKRAATEADMGEELMKNRIFPVSLMASAEAAQLARSTKDIISTVEYSTKHQREVILGAPAHLKLKTADHRRYTTDLEETMELHATVMAKTKDLCKCGLLACTHVCMYACMPA